MKLNINTKYNIERMLNLQRVVKKAASKKDVGKESEFEKMLKEKTKNE